MSNQEREVLLEVKNLKQYFKINNNLTVKAIDDISFKIYKGETFGLVGESGSGKSVFTKTFTGMLEVNGEVSKGEIWFEGENLLELKKDSDWEKIRGRKIATVFQDLLTKSGISFLLKMPSVSATRRTSLSSEAK